MRIRDLSILISNPVLIVDLPEIRSFNRLTFLLKLCWIWLMYMYVCIAFTWASQFILESRITPRYLYRLTGVIRVPLR
jgi:hypothetical protein